jgi:hypothetical protein
MRFHWRQYDTGWGELLCFAIAWIVGLGAVWLDYVGRPQTGADKVAVSDVRASDNPNLD